jgi:ferric-dicitrate binding protein FerR (iron transport regulator)
MSNERDSEVERERLLRQVFARAKPRPQPPPGDTEDVRRVVLAEWEQMTGRRAWRKRAGFAAAAAVALVAVLTYRGSGPESIAPAPLVASVEQVQGVVTTTDGARLSSGSGLLAGARLETGDAQLALRLTTGGSLRIAPRSRVVLSNGDEAELLAGAIYFDSEAQRANDFVVATQLGRIRDVGTQFLVQLDNEQLDVGVREGRISLMRGDAVDSAEPGERLVATQASDNVRRDSVATFGGDWEWAERLAPPFETDGRTIREILSWFESQTGRKVVFADVVAERAAEEVFKGSVDLPPLQKLTAVLSTTNLAYSLEGDHVVIRMR